MPLQRKLTIMKKKTILRNSSTRNLDIEPEDLIDDYTDSDNDQDGPTDTRIQLKVND